MEATTCRVIPNANNVLFHKTFQAHCKCLCLRCCHEARLAKADRCQEAQKGLEGTLENTKRFVV